MTSHKHTNSGRRRDITTFEECPESLARTLLEWYRENGRKFSFRRYCSPYHVLVSEIMLRKTTAKQVDKVFREFVERFPDLRSLASASASEVEAVIRPLGIRSRAKALVELARRVLEEHSGKIPDSYAELSKLPSVGEYVAGCVMLFCFGKRVPPVDTNVDRVLARVFGLDSLPQTARVSAVKDIYLSIMPDGLEREFHYAILDLSAALCRPKSPKCKDCPIRICCTYGKSYID